MLMWGGWGGWVKTDTSMQFRTEYLTCTFNANSCSANLLRVRVSAFAGSSVGTGVGGRGSE